MIRLIGGYGEARAILERAVACWCVYRSGVRERCYVEEVIRALKGVDSAWLLYDMGGGEQKVLGGGGGEYWYEFRVE
jgi:hypothetical protein